MNKKVSGYIANAVKLGRITEEEAGLFYSALTDERWRIQNLYKIKSKDKDTINLKLNPLQEEIEKTILQLKQANKPVRLIILKPRQIGCTTYFCVTNLDKVYWHNNQFCAVIAHLKDKAHEIFNETVRFSNDKLPKEIKIKAHNDNVGQYLWKTNQSQFIVTTDVHGITPNILHLTEVAHMKNPKEMISEALQGVPYQTGIVIMESTANGRGGFFYDMWNEAERDPESVWTPIFLKWWKHPDYCLPVPSGFLMTEEENALLKKFSWDGFTPGNIVFRRKKISELGKDKIDVTSGLSGEMSFQQNYPMTPQEAFIVPRGCFFNVEALHSMDLNKKSPIYVEQIGAGKLKVFEEKNDKLEYIIAADTAFGQSKDYSVAVVLEKKTKKFMASLRGKYGSFDFSKYLLSLGKFYNNALIAVERNMGAAVLNEIINHSDYDNIYYHNEYDALKNSIRKPGFATTSQSRPLILSDLEDAIRTRSLEIPDEIFIGECLGFGLVNDKWQAMYGNDDCVMALAIGNYLCSQIFEQEPIYINKPIGI